MLTCCVYATTWRLIRPSIDIWPATTTPTTAETVLHSLTWMIVTRIDFCSCSLEDVIRLVVGSTFEAGRKLLLFEFLIRLQ